MKNQQQAARIYADHVSGIRAMLQRLSEAGDRNFFTEPATANWTDVGSIEHLAHKLRDICDMTFSEGEYADRYATKQRELYEAH